MNQPKLPNVVAAILMYNQLEYTIDCVSSLMKVQYPNMRILIVDNGSRQDPGPVLRERFPDAVVHLTGENLGYTGGINACFRCALEFSPEYILVLNPDTIVERDFLSHLVNAMENTPRAAGACGTIYTYHDRTRVWYAGGRMIPWRGLAVHDSMGQTLDRGSLGEPRSVTFITGCMILFRVSALAEVGWEDERFFMSLDDVEFSARMLHSNYQLLYVPRAIIYHKVYGEEKSQFKLYYSVRNRFLLINTAYTGLERAVARIYFMCVILLKLCFWGVSNRPFYHAARLGLIDYFSGNLGRGRGVEKFRYREDAGAQGKHGPHVADS